MDGERKSLYQDGAEDFLKVAHHFKLGNLPTETPHEKTVNLSHLAKTDIHAAVGTILDIDRKVFELIGTKTEEIEFLKQKIYQTLEAKKKIFLCGCGATGRLSLALETIWRVKNKGVKQYVDSVVSFMAGGDVALIHSVEKFEDFPEFGERQLKELGFTDGDLLISTTEGGETPFVIGATEYAAKNSSNKPFFLYCNPDEILVKTAERSKRVIENQDIFKINLTVGPMALAGSTRMQATTILMYSVGLALWNYNQNALAITSELEKIKKFLYQENFHFLKAFIESESQSYQKNEFILYETDAFLGISILTDTTERSPTFSLYPFENQNDAKKNPSLSYMYMQKIGDNQQAWQTLLHRHPRTFLWPEVTGETSEKRLFGFNISHEFPILRKSYNHATHRTFSITFDEKHNAIAFQFENLKHLLPLGDLNFLSVHLVLKILMNNLSTVIMGRLGRYESNLMTWVRASNNKLIDRSVRYATTLLKSKGVDGEYDQLVKICFEFKDQIARDQALVLKMVDVYLERFTGRN